MWVPCQDSLVGSTLGLPSYTGNTPQFWGMTAEEVQIFTEDFRLRFENDRVGESQINTKATYISFSHIIRVLINIPGEAKITNLHHIVLR